MSENKAEVALGAVVLAIAIGFVVYLSQSTGLTMGGDSYQIRAGFRTAEGISVGTDVRLAGVKIGAVQDLSLNSETYRAEAVLAIQNDVLIPDDSALTITSEGLLGGHFVEVMPGASFDYLADGGEIIDTQGSVSLVTLLMKFVSGGSKE
ncbi:MAG: outer membrane lipid asymmetry maintenance protein MlaD [Rhodobacteraceae bacterium]|jgi:phospholipid/cholesterol/gamma-HCH transport system substrate-binding protein|nr:outer membrane lipid asymmetry maintenance protein MlaD [Paracoccaceae bacterium]